MRIIAFANQKGGVGKTTTSLNVSIALSQMGKKVLVIDLDAQGNLSDSLGQNIRELKYTINDVLTDADKKTRLQDVLIELPEFNLDLIPSNLDLCTAELKIAGIYGREFLLRKQIHNLEKEYDFIIMDCPPALNLLTINAFTSATDVIIPVQTQYYAMMGMEQLIKTITEVQAEMNPNVRIMGYVATMFNSTKNLHKDALRELQDSLGDEMFNSIIRENSKLGEAPAYSESIFTYAPDSNGAKDYAALTNEILERLK